MKYCVAHGKNCGGYMSSCIPSHETQHEQTPQQITPIELQHSGATHRHGSAPDYCGACKQMANAPAAPSHPIASHPVGEVRITDPKTGGQKGQKPERFSLIPKDALAEVAKVYGYGSQKYAKHNWAKGYDWDLSQDALERHYAAWSTGEDYDEESKCLHLASVVFHALTLIAFTLRGKGTDTRDKLPRK